MSSSSIMFYSPWKTCRRPLESIFGFTHDKTRWSFIFPRQKMHAHHGVCIAWDCNVGFGTIVAACKTSISCFSHDLPRIRGCLVPWPSRFPFGLVPFFSPPFVQFSLPTLVGLSLPPDPSCRDISCLAHLRPFLLSHCFVPRSSVLPVGRRRVVCALIFDVRVWVWIFPPFFFLSLSLPSVSVSISRDGFVPDRPSFDSQSSIGSVPSSERDDWGSFGSLDPVWVRSLPISLGSVRFQPVWFGRDGGRPSAKEQLGRPLPTQPWEHRCVQVPAPLPRDGQPIPHRGRRGHHPKTRTSPTGHAARVREEGSKEKGKEGKTCPENSKRGSDGS